MESINLVDSASNGEKEQDQQQEKEDSDDGNVDEKEFSLDETKEQNNVELQRMLTLSETVHEDSDFLLVWRLAHPQQASLKIKLYATRENVEALRTSRRIPSTMSIPLAVLPDGVEIEAGSVSVKWMYKLW
jgi:hypothetical protein